MRSRWITGVLVAGLAAAPAAAETSGIVEFSGKQGGLFCSNAGFGCHSAGKGTLPPLVRFEGPDRLDPGAEATYRFIVTSQVPELQIQAGFNVAASAGELVVVSDQQERLLRGELTHTGPKDNDTDGVAAWEFSWRAPSAPGTYVLFGAGNSVDGLTTQADDEGALTVLMVAVGVEPTPTPTPPPCAGDCNANGTVNINELIAGVNIALGVSAIDACHACDTDGSQTVSIGELITAVNKALNGC